MALANAAWRKKHKGKFSKWKNAAEHKDLINPPDFWDVSKFTSLFIAKFSLLNFHCFFFQLTDVMGRKKLDRYAGQYDFPTKELEHGQFEYTVVVVYEFACRDVKGAQAKKKVNILHLNLLSFINYSQSE